MKTISRMTTGHLFLRIMPGKMDFLERTSSWHARNWPDVVSEKYLSERGKEAMLHGNSTERDGRIHGEPSVLPTQQENIEKAVDMQGKPHGTMTGYNEVYDIIPTILSLYI